MKKIESSSQIEVGKTYMYSGDYFVNMTEVEITDFDGTDFWSSKFDNNVLAEHWLGYEDLCLGRPEGEDVKFLEID